MTDPVLTPGTLPPQPEQLFLRPGIPEGPTRTAFYRMDTEMRGFLNACRGQFGDVEGIVLSKEEDGSYGFNIGFIVPDSPRANEPL